MTPENKSVPSVKSVTTLESLVPPLDLCKQIPEGKFENSALVWTFDDRLMPRTIMIDGVRHYYRGFPAPTMQEILAEIPDVTVNYDGRGRWAVQAILPSRAYGDCNANPATAALKLYLSLLSDQSDPSDRSTPEAQP